MTMGQGMGRAQTGRDLLLAALLTAAVSAPGQPVPDESSPVPAIPTETSSTAALYLKVVSAETGLILPEITVTPENASPKSAKGISRWELPVGASQITVSADDHLPMDIQIHLTASDNPVMEVELEPEQPAEGVEVADDAAVLMGTVSDALSGQPIAGATVALAGEQRAQQTTATGSFHFDVKTGRASATRVPAATLEITAEGYQGVRLTDIPLAPGSAARLPVRLDEKTTDSEAIVEKPQWRQPGRNHAADWVFDVTLR